MIFFAYERTAWMGSLAIAAAYSRAELASNDKYFASRGPPMTLTENTGAAGKRKPQSNQRSGDLL